MDIREQWETLTPKGKRTGVIVAVVAVFLLIMWATDGEDRMQREAPSQPIDVTNILTDSDPRELGIDALSSQVRRLMAENEKIRDEFANLKGETDRNQARAVRNMAADYNAAVEEITELKTKLSDFNALQAQLQAIKSEVQSQAKKLDEVPKISPDANSRSSLPSDETSSIANESESTDSIAPSQRELMNAYQANDAPGRTFSQSTLGTTEGDPDKREDGSIRMISSQNSPVPNSAKKEDDIEESKSILLPAGAILSGILINGMDAPTGTNTKADPYPTLIRIKHEAVLPNYYRSDIRECMLIGATHGSLSDERAYTRLETITCIFNDDSVAEQTIDGYAVGEDGKLGMRGRLVSKNGVILARALTAGFLEGISSAFAGARVPAISGNVTQDQQIQSLLSSSSVSAAGLEGAGSAMEKLADYFIELAAGIYPVIEIDAGRQIEFVVTKGTSLKMN